MDIRYTHVLTIVPHDDTRHAIAARAKEIAQRHDAQLSLAHVVETLNLAAGYELMPLLPESPMDAERQAAEALLTQVASSLGLQDCPRYTVAALSTLEGVLELAANRAIDLIVIGAPKQSGWSSWFGSTATQLVQRASCDVLVVRL